MVSIRRSEAFYTEAKESKEDWFDYLWIDPTSKEYFLKRGDLFLCDDDEENPAIYVSRLVFDLLLEGIVAREFREARYVTYA